MLALVVRQGLALASVTSSFSSNVYTFDAADTANGSAATLSGAYGCLVYDDTLTTPVADGGYGFPESKLWATVFRSDDEAASWTRVNDWAHKFGFVVGFGVGLGVGFGFVVGLGVALWVGLGVGLGVAAAAAVIAGFVINRTVGMPGELFQLCCLFAASPHMIRQRHGPRAQFANQARQTPRIHGGETRPARAECHARDGEPQDGAAPARGQRTADR